MKPTRKHTGIETKERKSSSRRRRGRKRGMGQNYSTRVTQTYTRNLFRRSFIRAFKVVHTACVSVNFTCLGTTASEYFAISSWKNKPWWWKETYILWCYYDNSCVTDIQDSFSLPLPLTTSCLLCSIVYRAVLSSSLGILDSHCKVTVTGQCLN